MIIIIIIPIEQYQKIMLNVIGKHNFLNFKKEKSLRNKILPFKNQNIKLCFPN